MNKGDDFTKIRDLLINELAPVKRDIKTVKNDVSKIRKDVDVMLSVFDREYLELRKRVERIEDHLNLPSIFPK